MAVYLRAPNYVKNLKRLGFADADFDDGGSEALVDAVVVSGDTAAIKERVDAHLAAGATHVCIQALKPVLTEVPEDDWAALAEVLLA